uniref:Uncharacterized protein n=1 Tax=Rhizophora mucronata TaxID=61149 RepID=A0A2P2QIR1_RHIMU
MWILLYMALRGLPMVFKYMICCSWCIDCQDIKSLNPTFWCSVDAPFVANSLSI